jgi:RNA polymerase sigma factor (sigma-70 family)
MAKVDWKVQSDEELWDYLRDGYLEAINVLFRRHYRVLYSYGVKISRDEALAKDCIQEVFVEIWNKRETVPPVLHVKAYLLSYLRRLIFHTIHRLEKQSMQEWAYIQEFDVTLSHEDLVVQEQLTSEVKAKLDAALQKLTPRQREVIYLRFFDGLSCDAISEITSLKYQSVVNLIHEAIKKLREHVILTAALLIDLVKIFQ